MPENQKYDGTNANILIGWTRTIRDVRGNVKLAVRSDRALFPKIYLGKGNWEEGAIK
jgi:hypothetical protein